VSFCVFRAVLGIIEHEKHGFSVCVLLYEFVPMFIRFSNMTIIWLRFALFFGALYFGFSCCFTFSAELSYQQVFDIVRGLEKQIDMLYWKASVEQKIYGEDLIVSGQNKYDIEAFFDPTRKLYNVSYTMLPPDGITNGLSLSNRLAFDGNQYTFLDDSRKRGNITNNRMDSPTSYLHSGLLFSQEGLLPGLPSIFSFRAITRDSDSRADTLSSFLPEWKTKSKFIISEDGILNIIAEIKLLGTTNCPATVTLLYDMQKGGIVTSAVVRYKQLNEKKVEQEKELCNWAIEVKQNDKEKWVPYKIFYKEFTSAGRLGITLEATFDKVEINPPVESDMFVLSMPDGYSVDDFVNKLRYRVGTPFNEDRAIEDFMRNHDLTGNVPPQVKHWTMLRYTLMGMGIIMILIALARMIWKKLKT